jgi:hypothetical protein
MLLDAFIGHEANVHLARHLLEAVIPAPIWRRCDRAGSEPSGAPRGLWWDQKRAASKRGERPAGLHTRRPLVHHAGAASDSVNSLAGYSES